MRYFITGLFGIIICILWAISILLAYAGIGITWVCGKITKDDDMVNNSIHLFEGLHNALLEASEKDEAE